MNLWDQKCFEARILLLRLRYIVLPKLRLCFPGISFLGPQRKYHFVCHQNFFSNAIFFPWGQDCLSKAKFASFSQNWHWGGQIWIFGGQICILEAIMASLRPELHLWVPKLCHWYKAKMAYLRPILWLSSLKKLKAVK